MRIQIGRKGYAQLLLVAVLLATASFQITAQTGQSDLPALSGYLNDFAGVLDATTRDRVANLLSGLKQRGQIEFAVVLVKTTGGKAIFDYSKMVAREWGIGARQGKKKALLLLVSVDDQKHFVQISNDFNAELPDGLIGEVNQRLQQSLHKGNYSEGILVAVQTVIATLGEKLSFEVDGVDKRYAYGQSSVTPAPGSEQKPLPSTTEATSSKIETTAVGSAASPTPADASTAAPKVENSPVTPAATPTPAETSTPTPKVENTPATPGAPSIGSADASTAASKVENSPVTSPAAPSSVDLSTANPSLVAKPKPVQPEIAESTRNSKSATPAATAGEDEEEEVETTLALPAAERIEKLRAFISTHPKSSFSGRAKDLIVGARAIIGDQKLKAGDKTGAIEQFQMALAESTSNMSDAVFNGVILQIPLDLYVREERGAAFEYARSIAEKVQDDPKRVLAVAAFFLRTENPDEASRLANQVLKAQPQIVEGHLLLGGAYQISLRLDEATKEYERALELDPKSVNARRSLADLRRASGKFEDALGLYREQLKADPSDKSAKAGLVISLLDSGMQQEAAAQLSTYLKEDPRNLPLLVGTAYWYAAHGNGGRALELAKMAVDVEPRYTWAHIALARALVDQNHPQDAERALRFALQYGHFPTLDYELASALAASGLYTEAAETLAHSFTLKDGLIQTKLAGRVPAISGSFLELLAPERRASIFQIKAADSETNSTMMKGLMTFSASLSSGEGAGESESLAAADMFMGSRDPMLPFRQLYVAEALLSHGLALQKVIGLADAVGSQSEAALSVPAATIAVLADNLREVRASAINSGGTPAIPDLDRGSLSKILRGRIEEIAGSALLKSGKSSDAVVRLRRAVSVFPEDTIYLRDALWRLGSALDASGDQQGALTNYIRSYSYGGPNVVRRAVIEGLYHRVNGNLDGLDDKIGAASGLATTSTQNAPQGPSSEATQPTVASGNNVAAEAAATQSNVAPSNPSTEAAHDSKPMTDTGSTPQNDSAAPSAKPRQAELTTTSPATGNQTAVSAPAAPLTGSVNSGGEPSFTVQVGSYKDAALAQERAVKLAAAGVDARVVKVDLPGIGVWYRVQSGRFTTREEANRFGEDLKAKKLLLDFVVTQAISSN